MMTTRGAPTPTDRILIIEDDPAISRAVRISLTGFGYEGLTAATGAEGYELVRRAAPSAVRPGLWLPCLDGLALCSRGRAESTVPIIILAARGAEHEKITALEGGADDYVT